MQDTKSSHCTPALCMATTHARTEFWVVWLLDCFLDTVAMNSWLLARLSLCDCCHCRYFTSLRQCCSKPGDPPQAIQPMFLMMMTKGIKLQQMRLSSKGSLAHLQQTQAVGANVCMSPHPSCHMICGASLARLDGKRLADCLLVLLVRSVGGVCGSVCMF